MSEQPMRGVFPILVTPFDERDRIDEDSLRSEVDWCIEAGAHGLGIAYASEIPKLTDAERARLTRVVVAQAADRVPVVASIFAAANVTAAGFAREMEDLGATAVMCQAPAGASNDGKREFFAAISSAVRTPVFVQEAAVAVGGPLLHQIAQETANVRYAKVENAPPPQRVGEAIEHAGDLVTVFGGASGDHLIPELARGAQGTMPWPSRVGAFVDAWDCWQAGDHAAAREVWETADRAAAARARPGPQGDTAARGDYTNRPLARARAVTARRDQPARAGRRMRTAGDRIAIGLRSDRAHAPRACRPRGANLRRAVRGDPEAVSCKCAISNRNTPAQPRTMAGGVRAG